MHAILYSKDRPFQVQQLLKSIDRYVFRERETCEVVLEDGKVVKAIKINNGELIAKISVYYTYSEAKFSILYEKLVEKFPHYEFVLEAKENTVEQIKQLITNTRLANSINFFQFLVDDMLFFRNVEIIDILKILD